MAKVTNADVLSAISNMGNAIVAALQGIPAPAVTSVPVTIATPAVATAATAPPAEKPQAPPAPKFAGMSHPCDNSKRKVKVTVRDRAGKETQEEKNLLLRDETRQIIYPLLQQQIPLVQLQVIVNGKPTQHFVNLKCGKSSCGNIQYSTEKTSLPLSVVDGDGQHATIDIGTPAGIYFQANQVTAYPKG